MRIITGTKFSYIPFGLAHKILGSNEVVYEEIQDKYRDRHEMHWENKQLLQEKFKAAFPELGMVVKSEPKFAYSSKP
ncbi:MAG: hypothetical protein V3R78_07405 [Thermodesulfobacteriota bacterium]